MNIFLPYRDPIWCARSLDDLRLNKMIVETAQILCTAAHLHDWHIRDSYKPTHKNHPCVAWAAASVANWRWLQDYFIDLCTERYYRFGGIHKTESRLGLALLKLSDELLAYASRMTPFVNCTPYKQMPLHAAYQKTLADKWRADIRPPRWTNRETPLFYNFGGTECSA